MFRLIAVLIVQLLTVQVAYGRESDSISTDSTNKNRPLIGAYFRTTLSSNVGNEFVPKYSDPANCNCYYEHDSIREYANIGFSLGIQIRSNKFWNNFRFGWGLTIEAFRYSGSATETSVTLLTTRPSTVGVDEISYKFEDYFMSVPLLLEYQPFANRLSALRAHVGVAGASAMLLTSSRTSRLEYSWGSNKSFNQYSAFGICGFDYLIGQKPILSIGIEAAIQLDSTPNGRRLTSTGIKIGFLL